MRTRVLVLHDPRRGHVETMAEAVADGAPHVPGVAVDPRRVPELVPEAVARGNGYPLDQRAPLADPEDRAHCDAIVFGTPTRSGNMAAPMRNLLDRSGGRWARGALIGKVGSVFAVTGTPQGGQETTLTSFHTTLRRHAMVIVGLPTWSGGLTRMDEITGGTPCGAAPPCRRELSRWPVRAGAP